MGRKYRRDSSGRFAGGGGGGSTASRGASAKPKQAVAGQRKVTKRASVGAALKKQYKKMNTADKVGLVVSAGYLAVNAKGIAATVRAGHGIHQNASAIREARKFVRKVASDKRGIGANRPGHGLKAAKKSRGAYKIRSS